MKGLFDPGIWLRKLAFKAFVKEDKRGCDSLQPGYLIFVGFVLCGLALSTILKKITTRQKR
jgi:hypothetical protein